MKVGIIIAIESELAAFLDSCSNVRSVQVGRKTVYCTSRKGHEVYAVLSGYGEIDAAAATEMLIIWSHCDLIMNFGVTGALEPSLRVEDLFVVSKACHYDYDASAFAPVKKHQYADYPDEFIPLDPDLVRLARTKIPSLRETAVASGDRFIESREDKEALRALGCSLCDMEIAAIARTCDINGVRCLSIKCISDAYDDDSSAFQNNVRRSATLAFDAIDQILEVL